MNRQAVQLELEEARKLERAVEGLVKRAEDVKDAKVWLDDQVFDLKGNEATDINDKGVEAQIKYLLSAFLADNPRDLPYAVERIEMLL